MQHSAPSVGASWNELEADPGSIPSLDNSQLSDTSDDFSEEFDFGSTGIFHEYSSSHELALLSSSSSSLEKPSVPPMPDLVLVPGWDSTSPPSPDLQYLGQCYSDPTLYTQFPAWAGRKSRRKPKSLLRTPTLVQVTDGRHSDGIFPPQLLNNGKPQQPNVTVWRRGDGDLVEPPIWAGFPVLPSFPSYHNGTILTDGEKCDIYGRKECPKATAIALLLGLFVFPPAWFLLAMGYFDATVGVVPNWAKIAGLILGLCAFLAAVIVSIVLSVT